MVKLKIYGELPDCGDIVLSACDVLYYRKYAEPLIRSFLYHNVKNKTKIHLNVFHYEEDLPDDILASLSYYSNMSSKFTWSFTLVDNVMMDTKSFKQLKRFYVANDICNNSNNARTLVIDVDSICMSSVEFPKNHAGLFLRLEEKEYAMKVAAGCTLFSSQFIDFPTMFIKYAEQFKEKYPNSWSYDQPALYYTYDTAKPEFKKMFFEFNKSHMNWNFDIKECWFWTGKGDRSENDQTYLKEFNKWKMQ